jgi:hypothetical protein
VYVGARRLGRFLQDGQRRAALRALAPADSVIPRETGILVVNGQKWPEISEIVAEAERIVAQLPARPASAKGRKGFLLNVLDRATLTLDAPLMRLALREDVLRSVSHYLGVVPLLSTASVLLSDSVDRDYYSSQLYHCDGDDVTQVKIFVYCTDVDQASGPLTVLDAEATAAVMRHAGYTFDKRLTDEQINNLVGAERATVIKGPRGTTAFVDTSRCLHFGSRVAADSEPRVVAMIQYQTPWSFMPDDRVAPFRHLAHDRLPLLQRLVLGADARA